MKKSLGIAFVLLAFAIAWQGIAFAKLVSGRVVSVSEEALVMKRTNPITGADENIKISAKPETTYSGVTALGELRPDDQVWVETEQDKEPGVWKAVLVKKA